MQLSSLATVHKHIAALEAKKYVVRSPNLSRSLELAPRYYEETGISLKIPLAGQIAAGSPVQSYENPDVLDFADFASDKGTYALEVKGDSMIEDHICSGDYVLIERNTEPRNGDVVVALVRNEESTLKRFYKEPGAMIRLQPANSSMEPIRVPAADVEIQGRLLAVLRKYR